MPIHHFSLNPNKNRFPHFELVTVVLLMIMLYIGGMFLLPHVFDSVERVSHKESERLLIELVKHEVLFQDVSQAGGSLTMSVEDLIHKGHFDEQENEQFLRKFSKESFVVVWNVDGVHQYAAYLIERNE